MEPESRQFEIEPGLWLSITNSYFPQEFVLKRKSENAINLCAILSGKFELLKPAHLGEIDAQQMWLFASNQPADIETKISADTSIQAVDLTIFPQWFIHNADSLSMDESFAPLIAAKAHPNYLAKQPLSGRLQNWAQSIYDLKGTSYADNMLRKSHALEGLVALNQMFNDGEIPSLMRDRELSETDRKRVWHIREQIIADPSVNTTLEALSQSSGISTSKLKRDFSAEFREPVGTFIIECRMQRAKSLLERGERVSEVAYSLGYKFPESFSARFTKHFSYCPSKISDSVNLN